MWGGNVGQEVHLPLGGRQGLVPGWDSPRVSWARRSCALLDILSGPQTLSSKD